MSNNVIFLFLAAVANFLLAITVLKRNYRDPVNIYFSGFSFLISIWSILLVFFSIAQGYDELTLTIKLVYFFGSLASVFFLLFSYVFPIKTEGLISRAFKNIMLILLSIFLFLAFKNDWILADLDPINKKPVFGYGFYLLSYFIFSCFVGGIYFLYIKMKNLRGIRSVQIKYFLYGAFLTIFFIALFNIFLPLLNITNLWFLGPLSTVFFIGFTSYAIVKHRLMDIRFVVARSVAYAILLVILAAFYAGSVLGIQALFFPQSMSGFNFAEGAVRTIIAVIMVFLFQPLKRWITRATDKIFFKNQYNPEEFLDTLSHTIGSSIVLIELIYKTLNHIVSQIKITRGLVVVLTDAGHIYTSQSVGYKENPKIEERDIVRLVKDGVLVYDELEETSRVKHLLRNYDAAVAIPLKTENDTEGLLLLGEKQSGDMYSESDLRVFEIIAPELAVAIINSKSYEKIEKFNVTLRQEVKRATAELERKNEQLRELDKAKDEFISMASHQLRTPLTAIKGYLSMLLEGDAGEIKVSQYDFVNEAFQGANRMVGLINDLLNVSRMETGRFFLEPVEVDLDRVIGEEIKQLANHAKEKHLYLKYEKKGKVPTIWADETKIRQVVMNFIDNAIYYTTSGGVKVTLEKEGPDVVFRVEDTGIGVPKAAQKQLFTKFYRADNARHVRPDGTGLGIYLAKKVIDDHKGKLIFKSVEGKGSTFGFRFPIKSHLSTKRLTAPLPKTGNGTPAIGELAAGIGVSADALAATSLKSNEKKPEEKTPTESAKDLLVEAEIARDK